MQQCIISGKRSVGATNRRSSHESVDFVDTERPSASEIYVKYSLDHPFGKGHQRRRSRS